MLAKLQGGDLKNEIKENDVSLVYVFLGDHIRRNIGSMIVTFSWGKNMPYYSVDDHGALVRKGDFETGRPLATHLYEYLGKIDLIRHLCQSNWGKLDYPAINERHILFTAKIIQESKKEFKKQFGSDNIYVVLYPSAGYADRIIPYLQKADIRYLNYDGLSRFSRDEYRIPDDGHPNARMNKEFAEILSKDLITHLQKHQSRQAN